MSLQHLPLAQIKEVDLQRLIADAARESRVIDYKRSWQVNSEQEKREFLADVASFANATGGDLVYGVTEADGVPQALAGLDGFAQEAEQLRIEQLLARWISPRLAGVSFGSVPLQSGKPVFIVRIPRSWSAPHMVTFNGYDRFFSRHSTGKYPLDVTELRASFLQSAGAADRIRDFRLERVNRIATGEAGVKLWSPTCIVLHLLPLAEVADFDPKKGIDLQTTHLRPMGQVMSWGHQVNYDGLMVRSTMTGGVVSSYVQVFRTGSIEAVLPDPTMASQKLINPAYEGTLRAGLFAYRQALRKLGVTPPYFMALSLVNVGGFTMALRNDGFPPLQPPTVIDRPHLLLPMVAVEEEAESVDAVMRPSFDLVWNACGHHRSPNFDEQGKWKAGGLQV